MKYKVEGKIYNTRKEARQISRDYERVPENGMDDASIAGDKIKEQNLKKQRENEKL